MIKKSVFVLFLLGTWFNPALALHEVKIMDGIKVMLGTASVDEIKKHPKEHPEINMHGGPKGTHHLIVHLEEEKTGKIISDASVTVSIHNPDGTKVTKAMELMAIGGIPDFGNYFDFSDIGNYHIEVVITPKGGKAKKVLFTYEKRPEH